MENENQPISIADIKKRIVTSFFSLTARQIFLRAFSFLTLNIVLAQVLPVETLGIFNIATAVITFFAYFSDLGLAASLIQKKDQVNKEDVYTTFTLQSLIVGSLTLIIVIFAPFFAQLLNLNNDGVWLIRVLGMSFFLTSLKVVPSVMLERQLKFQPIVKVEFLETLIFNVLLIYLTFQGLGIWAFSISAIARSIIGVFAIYLVSPVEIGFMIKKDSAKNLLSFGIPFQLNSLLAVFKDRLVPLVVANMVGPTGIGYVTWAQNMAYLPLEFMNIVIRIVFPAFSRLQEDKVNLTKAVEKTLFATSIIVFPALFGLGALLPSIIQYVVSPKWQSAQPLFYFFAFSTYWAVISTTLTNTLNAVGQVKTTLKLMLMWTILTWILTPSLVYFFGYQGVAISSFLISFSSVITIILVKKIIPIKIINSIFWPTIASFVMALLVFGFAQFVVRNSLTLALAILFGAIIYCLILSLILKKRIISDIKSLKHV